MKKVTLEMIKTNRRIEIPYLKSKQTSMTLPKMDYSTKTPSKDQTFQVSEQEADCLMRCWPGVFRKKKKKKKEEIDNGIDEL